MFFNVETIFTALTLFSISATATPLPTEIAVSKRTICPIPTEPCMLHCDYGHMCWCLKARIRTFCYFPEGCDVECLPYPDPAQDGKVATVGLYPVGNSTVTTTSMYGLAR